MSSSGVMVRTLGAFERLYHRFAEDYPMHYSVAAEFRAKLTEQQVTAALAAVQERHPLLSVQIEDHPETRLAFYRPAQVPAIPLRVLEQDAHSWQQAAAEELSRPIEPSQAPLTRAVLISGEAASALVLTFYHSMVDGIGAMAVLEDVVVALDGRTLQPLRVPPSQEEVIAQKLPSPADLELGQPPAEDPRMTPAVGRPFDGTVPHVSTVALDAELTKKLVERCRSEETTVHGALVAAVSQARSTLSGEEFLRVLTPFNLRGLMGVSGQCVDYHLATRTGSAPLNDGSLWEQARAVTGALAGPRSAPGVVAASGAIQQFVPVDADGAAAWAVMAPLGYDLLISNLGVIDIDPSASLRPTALWGPVMLCQAEGEDVIGVTTFDDRLRIVVTSYRPTADLSVGIRRALSDAVE